MRAKAIGDQHSRLALRSLPGLRVEYSYEPLEAYLGTSIPRLRARVMPTRYVVRRPVTLVSARWPDYHRLKIRKLPSEVGLHARIVVLRNNSLRLVEIVLGDAAGTSLVIQRPRP